MASAGRRRQPLFVRIKRCQVEMEINIFPERGSHGRRAIIRDFRAPSAPRHAAPRRAAAFRQRLKSARGEIYGDFSAPKDCLVRTCGGCDTGWPGRAVGLEAWRSRARTPTHTPGGGAGGSGIRAGKKALLPGKIVGTRGTS